MKKVIYISVLIGFMACLSSCASVMPTGVIYTDVKSPVATGSGDASYNKVGVAKANSYFGMVATGDASIKAAMENGQISRIKYVDYTSKNILGIFGEYTTTVYGD